MKAGICTIPSRLNNYTKYLIKDIEKSCPDIELFIDTERKGHSWNYKRMMEKMLINAEQDEKILLCMDDTATIPEWKEYVDWLHKEAKTGIYVLFNRINI